MDDNTFEDLYSLESFNRDIEPFGMEPFTEDELSTIARETDEVNRPTVCPIVLATVKASRNPNVVSRTFYHRGFSIVDFDGDINFSVIKGARVVSRNEFVFLEDAIVAIDEIADFYY